MVQGILIPASDSEDTRLVELARLEDYQAAVGGWIEAVDIPTLGSTMYVNESGLMLGLPLNRRATYLWRYHLSDPTAQPRLVGDAILVGLPNRQGESTSVSADVQRKLLSENRYVVVIQGEGSGEWRPDLRGEQSYIEAVVWAVLVAELSGLRTRVRSCG